MHFSYVKHSNEDGNFVKNILFLQNLRLTKVKIILLWPLFIVYTFHQASLTYEEGSLSVNSFRNGPNIVFAL